MFSGKNHAILGLPLWNSTSMRILHRWITWKRWIFQQAICVYTPGYNTHVMCTGYLICRLQRPDAFARAAAEMHLWASCLDPTWMRGFRQQYPSLLKLYPTSKEHLFFGAILLAGRTFGFCKWQLRSARVDSSWERHLALENPLVERFPSQKKMISQPGSTDSSISEAKEPELKALSHCLMKYRLPLSHLSALVASKSIYPGVDAPQLVDSPRLQDLPWIGLVGKIWTGNPWVFTIKLMGFPDKKISHHPIPWYLVSSKWHKSWPQQ